MTSLPEFDMWRLPFGILSWIGAFSFDLYSGVQRICIKKTTILVI